MFGKKGSKILKLPPARNCFTLAMTNKLVVVINSLKVPKIKKMLLCEMQFLVPNYSCLQNPWLGDYRLQIPVLSVHRRQPNLLNPPTNKIPGYATGQWDRHFEILNKECTGEGKRTPQHSPGFKLNWSKICLLLWMYPDHNKRSFIGTEMSFETAHGFPLSSLLRMYQIRENM